MDFTLTDEQKQIKSAIKEFCIREVDPKHIEDLAEKTAKANNLSDLKAAYPYELLEKLHKAGFRQMAIPTKYGGTAPENGINLTLTIAVEEMGYWGGGIVDPLMIPFIFLRAIAANMYVTDEQRTWIFKQFIHNPRFTIGCASTEPAGGTDIALPFDEGGNTILKTNAYKEGNEWVVNGDKMFGTGCGVADLIMVSTRTNKEAPISQAMTFFWIPSNASGLTITPNRMVAQNFGGNCQTYYDNVRVSESNLIGQVNKGYSFHDSFGLAHLPGISGLMGGMQRIYGILREYAKQRIGGGKTLIQQPNIASKLGEMAVNLESLRALIYRSAWEIDQVEEAGGRGLGQANLFWFQASYALFKRVSWRFWELASDIYGGMSASVDLPLGGFLNQIFYVRAAGGTVDVNLIKSGREYDGRYRAA
jgi:alkylation response protein AidB-like acyl-CoA dehydrogenase